MSNPFQALQEWYLSQCDGNWEHQHVITIETLDNPGWMITIDLEGTELESRTWPLQMEERSESDWWQFEFKERKFVGCGGALNLAEVVEKFLGTLERAE